MGERSDKIRDALDEKSGNPADPGSSGDGDDPDIDDGLKVGKPHVPSGSVRKRSEARNAKSTEVRGALQGRCVSTKGLKNHMETFRTPDSRLIESAAVSGKIAISPSKTFRRPLSEKPAGQEQSQLLTQTCLSRPSGIGRFQPSVW